jgi:hypothetical protein
MYIMFEDVRCNPRGLVQLDGKDAEREPVTRGVTSETRSLERVLSQRVVTTVPAALMSRTAMPDKDGQLKIGVIVSRKPTPEKTFTLLSHFAKTARLQSEYSTEVQPDDEGSNRTTG